MVVEVVVVVVMGCGNIGSCDIVGWDDFLPPDKMLLPYGSTRKNEGGIIVLPYVKCMRWEFCGGGRVVVG